LFYNECALIARISQWTVCFIFFIPVSYSSFSLFYSNAFFIEGDWAIVHTSSNFGRGKYIQNILKPISMILYLYSPLITNDFGMTDITLPHALYFVLRFFTFSSFILSIKFLRKKIITYIVSYFLVFCYFSSPWSTGQREHILLMLFSLLTSTVLTLENRLSMRP